jgi:hypothetical protein
VAQHRSARSRRPHRRVALLVLALLAGVSTVAVVREVADGADCVGDVGMNWPAAGRVYLGGVDERSTTAAVPERAFTVAAANGLHQVRVLVGVDAAISAWTENPARATDGLRRMVDDAAEREIVLVLSAYPDLPMIGALAGREYGSWAAAQQDLVTPGSVPWRRFEAWLRTVVPALATDPTVVAWEVVNEPGYMLGMDSGVVPVEQGLAFFDHFAGLLDELGVRTLNGGGRPVYDPMTLTDQQLVRYLEHVDVLDDHLYPSGPTTVGEAAEVPVGTAEQGRQAVEATARWFARARELVDRPDMPAMLGEVGSQPTDWFTGVLTAATERGWPVLAWGYDAYDVNEFTDEVNPGTFRVLAAAATEAREINGDLAVVVGSGRCRPGDR